MSILLAIMPLFVAFMMLALLQRSGVQSGFATLLCAMLLVILVPAFRLSLMQAGIALGTGVGTALTVLYVLLPALLLYQVQRISGSIVTLSQGIEWLCPDREVQLLLLVIGVAPFVESVSGFGVGTVVIIPMLLALGLDTLQAAMLGLFGQIAVPWGALAIGTILGADLTHLSAVSISAQTALIGAPLPVGFGLLTLAIGGGRHALRRLWLAALLAGLLLAGGEWFSSRFVSVELAGTFASIPVMVLLVLWSRLGSIDVHARIEEHRQIAAQALLLAVAPYLILTFLLLLSRFVTPLQLWLQRVGVLHVAVIGLDFPLLYSPGFFILLAALASALLARIGLKGYWMAGQHTLRQFIPGALAIVCFLAASQVMRAGGMIEVLGTAAATLGSGYSGLAPWLGALGGWLTGSNAGSNAMFAQLQVTTSIKAHLPITWVMAAQNAAGSIATMASPARLVLAATAVGLSGKEGQIVRRLGLLVLLAVAIVMLLLIVLSL